jgi:4'-phosphopantetheinyl transferase
MLMSIFWLQQTMADAPIDNAWLCAHEARCLSGMKFAKRSNDWRLGRWTAKCAIAAYLGWRVESSVLVHIEIRPATSGAPEAFIAGQRAALGVSLSHCGGRAIAAVVPSEVVVGCDLEAIEPRLDAFVSDYFTTEEQLLVENVPAPFRPALVTLLWSAKESALKALHEGLRLDTRSVLVNIVGRDRNSAYAVQSSRKQPAQALQPTYRECSQDKWCALELLYTTQGRTFHGWWQTAGNCVRTLVTDLPLLPPLLLDSPL